MRNHEKDCENGEEVRGQLLVTSHYGIHHASDQRLTGLLINLPHQEEARQYEEELNCEIPPPNTINLFPPLIQAPWNAIMRQAKTNR